MLGADCYMFRHQGAIIGECIKTEGDWHLKYVVDLRYVVFNLLEPEFYI